MPLVLAPLKENWGSHLRGIFGHSHMPNWKRFQKTLDLRAKGVIEPYWKRFQKRFTRTLGFVYD